MVWALTFTPLLTLTDQPASKSSKFAPARSALTLAKKTRINRKATGGITEGKRRINIDVLRFGDQIDEVRKGYGGIEANAARCLQRDRSGQTRQVGGGDVEIRAGGVAEQDCGVAELGVVGSSVAE